MVGGVQGGEPGCGILRRVVGEDAAGDSLRGEKLDKSAEVLLLGDAEPGDAKPRYGEDQRGVRGERRRIEVDPGGRLIRSSVVHPAQKTSRAATKAGMARVARGYWIMA